MAGGAKERLLRPVERQPMRDWLSDKLNAKEIPGLEWVNKNQRIFRIKWCHGSRHGWTPKDSVLFEKWAQHSGRYNDGDPKRWKANFRCALNSLKDVQEIKDLSISKGQNAFRVYRMLEVRKKTDKPKITKRIKIEPGTNYAPNDSKCVLKDTTKNVRASARLAAQTRSVTSQADDKSKSSDSESEGYQTDIQGDQYMDGKMEEPSKLQYHDYGHTCSSATEVKTENFDSSSRIPNFDKIIPNFYKLEFGKSHCLPRHGSGFKVVQLQQQKPLTPVVEAFCVPLPNIPTNSLISHTIKSSDYALRNNDLTMKSKISTSSLMTEYSTQPSNTSLQDLHHHVETAPKHFAIRDPSAVVTFPDTPDGSDVSNDSNSNEYIEVTIYEEEVGETEESNEGCIVLRNLSTSYVSPTSMTSSLTASTDSQLFMNYRVDQTSGASIPYMYNPLTPP